jgi:ATP-dependent DNA ligase
MGSKSRETIYGCSACAAAEQARAARKEADQLACQAWNKRMLGLQGPAQPSLTIGDVLSAGYMFEAFEFCIPTRGIKVLSDPDWLHEIMYDGYRLRVERDGDRVRLITRGGYDWTKRYPWIVEAARKNRHKQFVLDGEAVILGVDGISDFNALHSGKQNDEVQLYAFDILAIEGDDLRSLPLSMRKAHLSRLLARRPDGIFISPFEQGEIGPELFRKACEFGLEGLVSKRRDRPYRGGRSPHWIKVKNREHPAIERVRDTFR